MALSIRKRVVDQVIAVLQGAAPEGVKVRKGRKAPANERECPMVQVYWHIEQVKAEGNPRRLMMLTRNLVLEIKITVAGDDDDFDVQNIWVVAALSQAGNLGGLVKNLSEVETVPYIEDSSENGTLTAGAIRYTVEFTTLPGDMTAGN